MTTTTTTTARTKDGRTVTVAVIPVAALSSLTAEGRAFEATDVAIRCGCGPRHWQIVNAAGTIIQLPSRSTEQAAAVSGPREERHDW